MAAIYIQDIHSTKTLGDYSPFVLAPVEGLRGHFGPNKSFTVK